MSTARIPAEPVIDGDCEGELVVIDAFISFFGEVDPTSGKYKPTGEELASKVLAFRGGRGSTVGSYVIYAMKHYGKAPACLAVEVPDPVVVAGCVMADIPLLKVELKNLLHAGGGYYAIHRRGWRHIEVLPRAAGPVRGP